MWIIKHKNKNEYYCGISPLTTELHLAYFSKDKKQAEHRLKLFKTSIYRSQGSAPWFYKDLNPVDLEVREILTTIV